MKSDQPQSMGIADVGSPNVVKVLMDDGRVLAKIIEQMGGTTMHEPPSDDRYDQGISIEKTLRVNKAATVSTIEKTDGPMRKTEPLSGVRALDIEGLSLDIGGTRGDDMVMKHRQGISPMISEMHASGFNGTKSKKYHRLLVYNRRGFDTDLDEEPLLSWIVTTTQQTLAGGEYTVLLDYKAHHGGPHIGE